MEESEFTNPNGIFVANGEGIMTFVPKDLPPDISYESIIALATEAHTQLGRLDGIGENLPNPELLIRPYIRREAVLSSKIEGTQASIIDIFQYEAEGKSVSASEEGEKRIQEVINYIRATDNCVQKVNSGEVISLEMMKSAHNTLLYNVRGHDRTPGKFREIQNWIGPEDSKIEDAIYVPPAANLLKELLPKIEQFIQDPTPGIPVLIQCALIHYQFEATHPFADGNGRIGRLLIPLILADRHILNKPLLYLSAYFERNRNVYYQHLLSVSQKSTWLEWIRFFLRGVIQQSQEAITNIQKLIKLKSAYDEKLKGKRMSGSVIMLTEYLFANPVITVKKAAEYLKVTYPPAKIAIKHLIDIGILEEIGDRQRNKIYRSKEILEIFT